MSDRIIDFNEIKNKAKDRDVDKLEDYMYSLYYQMAEGKITMAEFTQKIYQYMNDNNISQDKFLNMQKKLMERYGFDMSNIEDQLKSAGINFSNAEENFNDLRKNMSFQEKYKDRISNKQFLLYTIKNDKNNIDILLQDTSVTIKSNSKIDLNDIELSEFLCSYKKLVNDKELQIDLCENSKKYNY